MFRRLLVGGLCMVAWLGCATNPIDVKTDFDRTIDFSQIKTYTWVPMPDTIRAVAEYDAKIREVVKNQLEAKGVMEVEPSADPDVHLIYIGGMQDVQFIMDGRGWSWWGGWGGDVSTYEYKQGELVINMMDSDEKNIIWEGRASVTGDTEPNPQVVGSAVSKMFSEYPPQAGSK